MTVLPYGDYALLINFDQVIDIDVNRSVIALSDALVQAEIAGMTFHTPAYCSLTVGYDPAVTSFDILREQIFDLTANGLAQISTTRNRKFKIPVCYAEQFAPDMTEVMQQTGLSREEVITSHSSALYRVFMLGFLPGFVYLGKVPERLTTRRKESPRKQVSARSVGLAGSQTGIYPSVAPGGWQIIGRTPIQTYTTSQDDPFLIHAGDEVAFYAVSENMYQEIETAVANDTFDLNANV